jgi:hypothetical protein
MSDRYEQLAMRRRQLLLRSERLRGELAADRMVVMEALSGIDRAVSTARRFARPALLAGGVALALALFTRRRRRSRYEARAMARAGASAGGFAMRGLRWITLARRLLALLTVARAVARARRAQT